MRGWRRSTTCDLSCASASAGQSKTATSSSSACAAKFTSRPRVGRNRSRKRSSRAKHTSAKPSPANSSSQPGDTLVFQQRTFTVGHILPQAGNEDDITIRVNLETAQELLNRPGQVSAVLGLMCDCADGDPGIVHREVEKFISGIQVVDFTTRVRARQKARSTITEGTEAELEDVKASRAALREPSGRPSPNC